MRDKLIYGLVFCLILGSISCLRQIGYCEQLRKESFAISNVGVPNLSIDNNKIIFDYYSGQGKGLSMAIYEISENKLRDLKQLNSATKKQNTVFPSFSPDGRTITFIAGDDQERNIYTMNVDGSGVRQLTNNYLEQDGKNITIRYNIRPSFSLDGKRIIFIRIVTTRPGGGDPFEVDLKDPFRVKTYTYYDIYEIDISTGKERRLTNYEFAVGSVSAPYYMSDGRRFVFSGHGPQKVTGADIENAKDYKKKYQDNTIFIMDGENNVLQPAFVNGRHSEYPHVSSDDTIVFTSITNEIDGIPPRVDYGLRVREPDYFYNYDLFIYKRGTIKRLTKMKSHISWPSISPDGSRVVFLVNSFNLWMINTDGTGLRKIDLPWEQLMEVKINQSPRN